jgi:hypothetical protein
VSKSLTPIKAIRAKCRECGGNHTKTIRECQITDCPLFPYRMGKRPNGSTNLKKPDLKPQGLKGVIKEALQRYEDGRLEHGELDLSTDKRDFIYEAAQELLDCVNYCVFQILKLRRIKAP